jgi:pilus assembly protein FimV
MRKSPPSVPIVAVGCALLCAAGAAQALGFGRVINVSHLGEPLNFAATLRLEADESLLRECVSAEVLSGETRVPSVAVRVTLEPGSDAFERMVRVTTVTQIDEPVVTVTVSAGCNGRLTRSYVTLVDPPGVNLAQAGSTAPVTLPPQRVESQVAPVVAVVEAAGVASAPRPAASPVPAEPRTPAVRPERPRVVAAAAEPASAPPRAAPPRPRVRPAAPAAPLARSPGPRLRLDPAAPPATANAAKPGEAAALVATAASAAAMASDAAAAVAAAASAASAAEAAQRRLATIEENMARLREESQATQKALATLQASLEQAQSSRYTNPLVYALAALSALLALVVALLWWRQSRARPASQWWLAPAGAPAVSPAPRRGETPGGAPRLETEPAVMDERAFVRTLDHPPSTQPASPPPVPMAAPVVLSDPPVLRRELSVEELIDLEQQADFFVVLGQDEAAIDLLMGHVRSSGGASPLPYLKLLEIYRRRGEREAYERIRERFNRRFNAYAPDWDSDLMHGKSLEDYAPVMAQLQRLWNEPSRVTLSLDAALLREDGSADTFDLPAYRELLFLYSIARDLAEHPTSASAVDLLLPMDGEEPEKPIEKLTASRLMGFAATDQLTTSVDLDVTMALPGHAPARDNGLIGLINVQPKDGDEKF